MIRFDPREWKRFVEIPYFTNKWRHLGLDDHDLHALQLMLLANPFAGAVVRGAGGLRKCRYSPPSSGRGKSGSLRIGYAHFERFDTICLLAVFAKKDAGNFTVAQRHELKRLTQRLYDWLADELQRGKIRR